MHATVHAQHAALAINHRPGTQGRGRLAFHERGVVAVGYEANLLAVRLRGDAQLQPERVRAHGVLVEMADREGGPRQLPLRQ